MVEENRPIDEAKNQQTVASDRGDEKIFEEKAPAVDNPVSEHQGSESMQDIPPPKETTSENVLEGRSDFSHALSGVPVKVTAVLGRSRMSVGHLMNLKRGEVLQLDRKVGDMIDIWVNDKLVARGEIVVLDGVLGVTLIELADSEAAFH